MARIPDYGVKGWGVALCGALTLASSLADAASGWDIQPSIFAGINYSDNIALTESDTRSGRSYDLIPRIVLSREGPQFQTNADYRLQTRFNDALDVGTQTFHFLDFDANAEIVDDTLGVLLDSQITQQASDPGERTSLSTRSATILNVVEVTTAAVQPYFTTRIGGDMVARADYRFAVVENEEPRLIDSKEQRGSASLRYANPTSRLTWTLALSDTTLEYDSGTEINLRRGSVDLGWRITPRAELVLNFGEDVNDYGSLPTQGEIDGFFWLAGLRGSLDDYTEYELRVGEQFFGDSYVARFTRQQRRLTIDLNYNESASTLAGQQIDYESLLSFLNNVGGFDLPGDTQDVFITKRFNLATTYQLQRSSYRLSMFHEDREFITVFQGSGGDTVYGAGLDWTWNQSERNSINVGVTWQTFDLRNSGETPETTTAIVNFSRRLTSRASADLRFIASDRSGSTGNGNFSENAITLGVRYEF